LDPSRAKAVEKDANGNLDTRKDKEIDRCEQSDLRRIEPEFGRERWRDGGIDRSEEEGKIVSGGKRKEYGED